MYISGFVNTICGTKMCKMPKNKRTINNRIKDEIRMTEDQAGKSTADHINILKSIINHSKRKKKQKLYISFLDVTKAYDKVWLNAIMYTVHKYGLDETTTS